MSGGADNGLVHRFVHGLRIDCQPQYLVVNTRGRRSLADLPLPWAESASGDEADRLCLLQAAVVLGRTRPWMLTGTLPAPTDSLGLAEWCRQSGLAIQARVEEVPLGELGEAARAAMDRGGACGVQLKTDTGMRWVFVSGTEADGAGPNRGVRALLLIDPEGCPPWGAGYNARIELHMPLTRGAAYQEGTVRLFRTIHGGRRAVHPKALLVVEPSGLELPLHAPHQL